MVAAIHGVCGHLSGSLARLARLARPSRGPQVDEVQGLMQGTIENMLSNQEQLTSLRGKTDAIAGQSKGFYRDAKTNRQKAQCEDMQCKLILGGAAVLLFFFLFGALVIVGASGWSDSTEACVAAVLVLPAVSLATPAATSIVMVASEAGVMVAVYVVPLPEIAAEPLLSVMSLATKLATDSLNVTVTAKVDPVAGLEPE